MKEGELHRAVPTSSAGPISLSTISLQPRQVGDLARRMVRRHLHVERRTGVPEVLCGENSALLADEESG